MASELKVNTLTGVSTAGSIAVTAEGNSTTTNLQQGLAKCWIQFNGTGAISTQDSFNRGGLTDNGTGDYSYALSITLATRLCLGGGIINPLGVVVSFCSIS